VTLPLEHTYWIAYPKLRSSEAKIVTLRNWLLAEAADDERALSNKRLAGSSAVI
jgi:hypothetical protein